MSSPPANVNEGERWTIGVCAQGMCEATIGAGICRCRHEVVKPGLYRYEDRIPVEVVPAKALREAREELERLRELCREIGAYGGPLYLLEPSQGERPDPARAALALRSLLTTAFTNRPSASGSSLASEPKLDGSGR